MSFSSQHLFFEDIEVGQEWLSSGRTLTETDIVNFAGLSGDFNPMHLDHEYAKSTPFRRPIAHGLLIVAIGSGLGVNCPPMRTVAFLQIREWNFREPVFIGDTLRMRTKVLEKTLRGRGRRGEVIWSRIVLNQNDKVVHEGSIVTLVEGKLSQRSATRNETVPEAAG